MAEKQDRRKGPRLTARQERFVAEYLTDLNATQAAIRAGYSAKTAKQAGARMLTFVAVADAIAAAKTKRLERVEITQDRVLEELAILAFSDVTHYVVDDAGYVRLADGAPAGANRAIASIKRHINVDDAGNSVIDAEIKLWDKPGPLKLAGRHVGLFPDRIEVTGKDGGPLEIKAALTSDERRARAAGLMEVARSRAKPKDAA